MKQLLLLVPLLLIGLALTQTSRLAAANAHGTIISGGDLAHSVRMAKTDEDAFRRRLDSPPKLDDRPELSGDGYTVTTTYWDDVLRGSRNDREAADPGATYYEDGGFVRARQDGEDVWLALDTRQRAILDRYLNLTRAGLLGERPGILEVLAAASRSENIGVHIGGSLLTDPEWERFWASLSVTPSPAFLEQPQRPAGDDGAWLIFSLKEGRSVQVFYDERAGTLTDSFGTEVYTVAPQVALAIESPASRGGSALAIQQEQQGSPLWWLIMIGGGLSCLAVALWLKRRLRLPESRSPDPDHLPRGEGTGR